MSGSHSVPYDSLKRSLDILGASILLVAATPVMAVVALLVAGTLGGPILFRQERPGKDGQIFLLLKFRTMRVVGRTEDATDEDRLTHFGRRLRSTSIDELPALVNVIKGEMSLVGPRPLLVAYLDRYTPAQARRHEVRPGITGLAQIGGRNAIGWEEKFALDVRYIDTRSLRLDAKILLKTVASVIRRDGISAEGWATAPEFRGSGHPIQAVDPTLKPKGTL